MSTLNYEDIGDVVPTVDWRASAARPDSDPHDREAGPPTVPEN